MSMRAAVLYEPGFFKVQDVPIPSLGLGEVLVRTAAASICGSDLHAVFDPVLSGTYPRVPGYPGHESVGNVVDGGDSGFKVGNLVLVTPVAASSAAFAELQVVDSEHLIGLNSDDDPRVLLMAQQLGTVIFALKRFWPGAGGNTALVVGAGSAGLHFVRLLKDRGFRQVVVSDPVNSRLELAREFGADLCVPATGDAVVDEVMRVTNGIGADLAVDAAGLDATRRQALRAVRHAGRVGFYGLPEGPGDMTIPFSEVFRRQPTIEISVGAQSEPHLASFREAVGEIERGDELSRHLVTHCFELDDVSEAFRVARERLDGAIKVVFTFGETRGDSESVNDVPSHL